MTKRCCSRLASISDPAALAANRRAVQQCAARLRWDGCRWRGRASQAALSYAAPSVPLIRHIGLVEGAQGRANMRVSSIVNGLCAASLLAGSVAASASANTGIGPFGRLRDIRAQVGVSVPIGGRRGTAESRPNIHVSAGPTEFNQRLDGPLPLRSVGRIGRVRAVPSRIALTLDARPQFLVNGRTVAADERSGLSTLGTVGVVIGGIAALGLVSYVVLLNRLDCDPGDECS